MGAVFGAGVTSSAFVLHGSADKNYASLASEGFLKKYWRTASGAWQRFGAGFYFAPDASKSHECKYIKQSPP